MQNITWNQLRTKMYGFLQNKFLPQQNAHTLEIEITRSTGGIQLLMSRLYVTKYIFEALTRVPQATSLTGATLSILIQSMWRTNLTTPMKMLCHCSNKRGILVYQFASISILHILFLCSQEDDLYHYDPFLTPTHHGKKELERSV